MKSHTSSSYRENFLNWSNICLERKPNVNFVSHQPKVKKLHSTQFESTNKATYVDHHDRKPPIRKWQAFPQGRFVDDAISIYQHDYAQHPVKPFVRHKVKSDSAPLHTEPFTHISTSRWVHTGERPKSASMQLLPQATIPTLELLPLTTQSRHTYRPPNTEFTPRPLFKYNQKVQYGKDAKSLQQIDFVAENHAVNSTRKKSQEVDEYVRNRQLGSGSLTRNIIL